MQQSWNSIISIVYKIVFDKLRTKLLIVCVPGVCVFVCVYECTCVCARVCVLRALLRRRWRRC